MEWGRLLHKLQINPRRTFSRLIKKKIQTNFLIRIQNHSPEKKSGIANDVF